MRISEYDKFTRRKIINLSGSSSESGMLRQAARTFCKLHITSGKIFSANGSLPRGAMSPLSLRSESRETYEIK